mmetsp:Transcript_18147/g.26280  ORF Transcript_18147/g.26280 Transcript_18147/m.26280 type:complete len:86 (-) Transcript_18147:22-279(-)
MIILLVSSKSSSFDLAAFPFGPVLIPNNSVDDTTEEVVEVEGTNAAAFATVSASSPTIAVIFIMVDSWFIFQKGGRKEEKPQGKR